jgi:hypothetical protein
VRNIQDQQHLAGGSPSWPSRCSGGAGKHSGMTLSDTFIVVIVSAFLNGAIIWGVVRTELKYLRRDVDRANLWIDEFETGRRKFVRVKGQGDGVKNARKL